MVAFQSIAKPLLFVHAICAVAALATSIHLLWRLVRALRGRPGYYTAVRLHARILAAAYVASFVLGAVVYPTFRVHVRAAYFDKQLPWATMLFEWKEHAVALGLLPAILLCVLAQPLTPAHPLPRAYAPLFCALLGVVIAALGYGVWCGWYMVSLRSV